MAPKGDDNEIKFKINKEWGFELERKEIKDDPKKPHLSQEGLDEAMEAGRKAAERLRIMFGIKDSESQSFPEWFSSIERYIQRKWAEIHK